MRTHTHCSEGEMLLHEAESLLRQKKNHFKFAWLLVKLLRNTYAAGKIKAVRFFLVLLPQ